MAILGTSLLAPYAIAAIGQVGVGADPAGDSLLQSDPHFVVGGEGLDGPALDQWPPNEGPGESQVSAEVASQSAVLTAIDELEAGLAQLGMAEKGLVAVDWEAEAIDLYWDFSPD